jgi:hypothetical protein
MKSFLPGAVPLALILSIAIPFSAHPMEDSVTEAAGSGLEVRSDPPGADVFVDGVRRGETPLTIRSLPAGQHYLRLEKDGYWTRETIVALAKDRRIRVSLALLPAKGRLEVEVYADEAPAPPAPIAGAEAEVGGARIEGGAIELAEGAHTVTVRAFGFRTERRAATVRRGETAVLRVVLRRAPFAVERVTLSRRAFNPGDSGSLGETVVSASLSAPGSAVLSVVGPSGAVLRKINFPDSGSRVRSVSWNGEDAEGRPLPDGTYRLVVSAAAGTGERASAETAARIDTNTRIVPAAASQDSGGLLFCPAPVGLSRGAFELGAAFLAGHPRGAEEAFGPPPFSLSLRASPADRWEMAANLRAEPEEESLSPAAAGSAKRTLFGNSASALAGAAVARWGWGERDEPSAFAAPPGIELALPFSASFGVAPGRGARIELIFSPSALWSGDDGLPERGLPAPAVSAGATLRGETLSFSLSVRSETEYRDDALARGALRIAAETRWRPGASVLSCALIAGAWEAHGERGAFGGGALGFVY